MKPAYLLCLALAAAGCSRAANIGQPPELTSPRETEAAYGKFSYAPTKGGNIVAMVDAQAAGAATGRHRHRGGVSRRDASRGPGRGHRRRHQHQRAGTGTVERPGFHGTLRLPGPAGQQ